MPSNVHGVFVPVPRMKRENPVVAFCVVPLANWFSKFLALE
jgi:hypothetical protein